MIVDSTNPRIMADNIRELARNGGGGGGSDLPDVTIADNGKILGVVEGSWNKMDAPSGVSHYKITSGSIEGTFAEVLADLTAGKLVCLDVYSDGMLAVSYFRDGLFTRDEEAITQLGFYTIANKIQKGILSSDGSFTLSREYPLNVDYSTSEQNTGKKWINGKEIYQRTLVVENFAITSSASPFKYGSFNIDSLIPNIDYLWVDNKASHIIQDGNQRQFVYGEYQGADGLFIYSVATRTSCTLYVTVLYTKATPTETRKRKTTKGEN